MLRSILRFMRQEFWLGAQLCGGRAGYARCRKSYDNRGKLVDQQCFDVDGHALDMSVRFARVGGVIPGYPAAKAGIERDDLFLQYGTWQWSRAAPGIPEQALAENRERAKRLVMYRRGRGIATYDFPPGPTGASMNDGYRTKEEIADINAAWAEYLKKPQAEAKSVP